MKRAALTTILFTSAQGAARQWLTFALGRALGAEDEASGGVRDLIVAIAKSDAFRYVQVTR